MAGRRAISLRSTCLALTQGGCVVPAPPCDRDEVRFSAWANRDHPSATGDWETRALQESLWGPVCADYDAVGIEARVSGSGPRGGLTPQQTGETTTMSLAVGFFCVNARNTPRQGDYACSNYQVRYECCPPASGKYSGTPGIVQVEFPLNMSHDW